MDTRILDFVSGLRHLPGMRLTARAYQLLVVCSRGQIDAHPGGMKTAAKQLDDFLQRRTVEGRPARRKHASDFCEQFSTVTMNFQLSSQSIESRIKPQVV